MKKKFALMLIASLTACEGIPPPSSDPQLTFAPPDKWSGAKTKQGEILEQWWRSFDDEKLPALIQEALLHNHDLAAAAARVEIAAIQAKIAGASSWPSLGLGIDSTRQHQNFIGLPIPSAGGDVISKTYSRHGVSLTSSWEIDLWGRLRASRSAAAASAQASIAGLAEARHSLAAQTAKLWFAAVEARLQLELAHATLESYRSSLATVNDRFSRGVRPAAELRLARNSLETGRALVAQREEQAALTIRQFELLLGRYPSGALVTTTDLPKVPGPAPAGLPSELLTRRPDVIAAERRLAEQVARVDEARAALYPTISLTTAAGTATEHVEDMVSADTFVWNVISNLTQPIFQGGRLRANVELAQASTKAAAQAYASAAVIAYAEVESALVAEELLRKQLDALRRASEEASAARQLTQDRYGQGLGDFLPVLEAQRRELSAKSSLLSVRRRQLDVRIDLHLALGGGFGEEPDRSKP
jgi:NodT family efflux transporter outer membrane factor (OMF) lipoprotein